MPKFKHILKLAVLAFFAILAVSCENPLEDRVNDLEAEQARQQELLDSLYEAQQNYIDSLYAYQQEIIENFLATVPNSEFTDVEVFSGVCPSSWTDLDLSGVTGESKSLVILKVERLSSESDKLVFRPNGETTDWLSDSDAYYSGTTSALSVIDLGLAEAGLAMVYTDDMGLVELRTSNIQTLEAAITVMFYFHNN